MCYDGKKGSQYGFGNWGAFQPDDDWPLKHGNAMAVLMNSPDVGFDGQWYDFAGTYDHAGFVCRVPPESCSPGGGLPGIEWCTEHKSQGPFRWDWYSGCEWLDPLDFLYDEADPGAGPRCPAPEELFYTSEA